MKFSEKSTLVFGRIIESYITLFEAKGNKEYSIFLFFLHLRHENIIKRGTNMPTLDNASNIINWFLYEKYRQINPILEELFEEFHKDCERVDSVTFNKLWEKLNLVTDEEFNNCYSDIIEISLIIMGGSNGSKYNKYLYGFQPIEVTKLISMLCPCSENMTVYNPFAGFAQYGIEMKSAKCYYGQESNSRVWALGIIRLISYNISITNFKKANSIIEWGTNSNKNENQKLYDIIVSTPQVANNEEVIIQSVRKFSNEEFFLLHGIESLTSEGKMIGVFSNKMLNDKKNYHSIRERIVNEDILEMVISLPKGLFSDSPTPRTILVFNKDKRQKGFVKMVDATSAFEINENNKTLKFNEIYDQITSNTKSDIVKIVSNNEIASKEYNLIAYRYIEEPIIIPNGFNIVTIGTLMTLYKSAKHNDKRGKCVNIARLANNLFDSELESSNLPTAYIRKTYIKIASDVLLIYRQIGKLKPTICKASEESPVYCSSEITPCIIDKTKVDIYYLINELNSDYVNKQIESIYKNSEKPFLDNKDLLSLQILLPSKDFQITIVDAAKNAHMLVRAKELGFEATIQRMKQDYIDEVRIKKHNLAQHLNNIQSSIYALSNFILEKGIGSELISIKREITLEMHIARLIKASKTMGNLLDQLTKEDIFGEPQIFDLDKFLKDYILKHSLEKYSTKYVPEAESLLDIVFANKNKSKLNDMKVNVNKQDLTELLDNIFNNALNHGFTDNNKRDYMILVKLKYDSQKKSVNIIISNNGNPFPKGMDSKRYSIKGEKAGKTGNEGLGGYRVKSIIEHYGGDFMIVNDEDSPFPVVVSINLPIYRSDEEI